LDLENGRKAVYLLDIIADFFLGFKKFKKREV